MEGFIKGALLVLGVILMVVVLTPLYVFFGWVTGLIIKLFCGQFVADGLNVLFGTQRFSPDVIPLIGGALGFVGAFFKNSSSSNKSKN